MYREAERGRFDAYLVRDDIGIAFTDYDCVRLDDGYREEDRRAVIEFAEQYDLPIIWEE